MQQNRTVLTTAHVESAQNRRLDTRAVHLGIAQDPLYTHTLLLLPALSTSGAEVSITSLWPALGPLVDSATRIDVAVFQCNHGISGDCFDVFLCQANVCAVSMESHIMVVSSRLRCHEPTSQYGHTFGLLNDAAKSRPKAARSRAFGAEAIVHCCLMKRNTRQAHGSWTSRNDDST